MKYEEICSCGATLRHENSLESPYAEFIVKWRAEHKHEPKLNTLGIRADSNWLVKSNPEEENFPAVTEE
jgi:hypothetical protein